MPTYQYRCTQCGRELEVVQKFTDAALTECDSCQGALRKVYNAVGVVFKGSGFYRTDSRKAEGHGASGGSADQKSGDSGSGEKSGDKSNGTGTGEKAPATSSSGSGSSAGSSGGGSSNGSGSTSGKAATSTSSTAA